MGPGLVMGAQLIGHDDRNPDFGLVAILAFC